MRLQESRGQPWSSPSNPQHPHLGQVIRVNGGLQIVLALFSYSCQNTNLGVVYKSALHKYERKLDAGHEGSSTRMGKEQQGSPGFPTLCSERFPLDQAVDVMERCACVGSAVVSLSLPPLLRLSLSVVQRWCEARILRTFSQRLPANSLSFRFFWGITMWRTVWWMCFHLPTAHLAYVLILFACHIIHCMLNQKNRLHLTHWHQGAISLTW